MGRKPKINAPQDVPAVEDEQDFFDEVLATFDEENGVEIEGRIYRKTKPEDSIGRMSFEAIAKVSEIVDEDWIGRHFGGGNYFIKWTFKQGERKEIRQKNYAVGTEYDKFVKEAAPAVSGTVPGVSGLIWRHVDSIMDRMSGENLGYQRRIVSEPPEMFGVDILSCPYHELARELGNEKAVLCICHMDKAYMQGFHRIRYERTTAVSEGAECCDYRLRFDPEKK